MVLSVYQNNAIYKSVIGTHCTQLAITIVAMNATKTACRCMEKPISHYYKKILSVLEQRGKYLVSWVGASTCVTS